MPNPRQQQQLLLPAMPVQPRLVFAAERAAAAVMIENDGASIINSSTLLVRKDKDCRCDIQARSSSRCRKSQRASTTRPAKSGWNLLLASIFFKRVLASHSYQLMKQYCTALPATCLAGCTAFLCCWSLFQHDVIILTSEARARRKTAGAVLDSFFSQ